MQDALQQNDCGAFNLINAQSHGVHYAVSSYAHYWQRMEESSSFLTQQLHDEKMFKIFFEYYCFFLKVVNEMNTFVMSSPSIWY